MRIRHTRIAAASAAVAAGVLAAMSLQPGAHASPTLAARNPAVEVRTQVIRRTVHVSAGGRHGSSPARGPAGAVGLVTPGASGGGTTRASGSHTAAASPHPGLPVATRPSPGHTGSAPATSGPRPVVTRPTPGHSRAGASASPGAPVSTHTSGSRHSDDRGQGRGDD